VKIQSNSVLLFVGDSITDCGRARPIGEDINWGLGNGYVSLVQALLGAARPKVNIRVRNTGMSGNTVRDLAARWQTDVLDLSPDWLSIMIGVNDVWRQFDAPLHTELHVGIEEYESTLDRLISSTRPRLKGLALMAPFFIEPNRKEPMRAAVDRYGVVVRRLAAQHNAIFVDSQAAMDVILKTLHPAALAGDRVHPTLTGHMILAKSFLKAVEFATRD